MLIVVKAEQQYIILIVSLLLYKTNQLQQKAHKKTMQKKSTHHPPTTIRSSKQTVKSSSKKPPIPINPIPYHDPISNTKKRTNSSYIQNSNKKKLQEAGYSYKKYDSNSSLKNNKHKIFEVEHMMQQGMGNKSTKGQNQPKVYSVITSTNNNDDNNQHNNKSISHNNKKKIKRNFRNNSSLVEIGCNKKVIAEKTKAMSSCQGKVRTKGLVADDSPVRKQDNIKTDLDQCHDGKENYVRDEENRQEENNHILVKQKSKNSHPTKHDQQNHPQNHDISRLANIDVQQLKHMNELTSHQLSQLQSRSQTIDLLKFTIKTKLQKDILSQSPHKLNSLLSSYQKAPNYQYIQQIMRLKQLQTNFYVQKITILQNELNKYSKQAQRQQKDGRAKWQQESRKVLVEKSRLQEENMLLKRENEALRTIIMKKLKPNNSSKIKNSEHYSGNSATINEYQ